MYQIAICDDEISDLQHNIQLTESIMAKAGLPCSIAAYESSQTLLSDIQTGRHFDLLLLDIEMPGLTGLEVARKIRETDKNCAILFLTGFDKFDYARQAISVRAMDYLLKPYNEQELVFAVEDAIRQVSVPLPAHPAQPPAPAEPLRREEDEDMRTAIIRAEISRFIDAHYREDISMQDAAAALRYSDAYFCKLFKQCFKVNFSAYLNEYRVNKARQLILDPRLSLKDIGAAVGYSDANYFTRVFKRLTGQTPSEYRVAAAEKAAQG